MNDGKVIGVRVSRMDPLLSMDPAALAVQLAQHMANAEQFRKDAKTFMERAKIEDNKAIELQRLIRKVNEYRKNLKKYDKIYDMNGKEIELE